MDDHTRKHGLIKGDLHHPVARCALWKDLTQVNIAGSNLAHLS